MFSLKTFINFFRNFIPVNSYECPPPPPKKKNVPKNRKLKFSKLTCLFLENDFYESLQDFTIEYPL